jgi:hypothetical protein
MSTYFRERTGLASHLKDSYRCPNSSNYQQPTAEPARHVLQGAEASNALHEISALASAATRETATDSPDLRRLHIDYAHSISIGVHKEKYFLLTTLDEIDFTFCSVTVDRTEPESLIHEFMTLTRLKIDCIRYDGAASLQRALHSRRSVSTIISRWRKLQHILIPSMRAPKVRYAL